MWGGSNICFNNVQVGELLMDRIRRVYSNEGKQEDEYGVFIACILNTKGASFSKR